MHWIAPLEKDNNNAALEKRPWDNGLPLVVIELKKPGVPARAAFDENLTHYKRRFRCSFGSTRCSSLRTARTAASARSRQIGNGSSSANASSARTSRAGCRWR